MSRWRFSVIFGLFAAPFLFLMAYGSIQLWIQGWAFYAWWPMALCITLSLGLAYYWQRKRRLLPKLAAENIPHGAPRDQEAWKLVEARAAKTDTVTSQNLTDPNHYLQLAQEMALELARFYHPGAPNPYGMLTVPELLSVAELAAQDLREMVEKYVPASHILTIDDYKRARQAADWYRRANNAYWVFSAFLSPIQTAARYLTSRVATGGTWDLLQQNILAWFYASFVQRLGTYLIELHSGRLRVGADRYRQLMAEHAGTGPRPAGTEEAPAVAARAVTVTLTGQVKAGKSSLINAFLGEQKAQTDVLPLTNEITRYTLQPPGIDSTLALFDTVGYGHEGPTEDQLKATEEAARQSDVLLLVMHARNPARQADVQMFDRLRAWFAENASLRMPPVIAVVSHIDLLTPAMEWAPPYNWLAPQRTKEVQIQQALQTVRDQFGERLAAIVPVCTSTGKVFGVEEALLPAIVERLGEARSVALLRCLKAEVDQGKVKRVFQQLLEVGREAAKWLSNAPSR